MSEITRFKHFVVHQGPVTIIRFTTRKIFDDAVHTQLQKDLFDFVEANTPQKLVIDFTEVDSFSSMVINYLLRINKIVTRDNPGQLKLCGLRGSAFESIRVLHLDKSVFKLFDTVEEATAAFEP